MVNNVYQNRDDQRLYVKLLRTGLTGEQAIAQLELMGIDRKFTIGGYDGIKMYRYPYSVVSDFSEIPSQDSKKKFPYYHGKRRY